MERRCGKNGRSEIGCKYRVLSPPTQVPRSSLGVVCSLIKVSFRSARRHFRVHVFSVEPTPVSLIARECPASRPLQPHGLPVEPNDVVDGPLVLTRGARGKRGPSRYIFHRDDDGTNPKSWRGVVSSRVGLLSRCCDRKRVNASRTSCSAQPACKAEVTKSSSIPVFSASLGDEPER